jgi:hypothetical protein
MILLNKISQEREGLLIDRDIMKNSLAMLVDLGINGINTYEEEFERSFLEETRLFYRYFCYSLLSILYYLFIKILPQSFLLMYHNIEMKVNYF